MACLVDPGARIAGHLFPPFFPAIISFNDILVWKTIYTAIYLKISDSLLEDDIKITSSSVDIWQMVTTFNSLVWAIISNGK